jgi:hypothetical protein
VRTTGLKKKKIVFSQEASKLIAVAQKNRTTRSTIMNESSSRSHFIVQLEIENKTIMETTISILNFVDLAGAESLDPNASSIEKAETMRINTSLFSLKKVVSQILQQNINIPYRESKLTRILQSTIGGNCQTAFICTILPTKKCFEISKRTLEFAAQVTNIISVNVNIQEAKNAQQIEKDNALKEKVIELDKENSALKQKIFKIDNEWKQKILKKNRLLFFLVF